MENEHIKPSKRRRKSTPKFPYPVSCPNLINFGSASNCTTFRQVSKDDRRSKVRLCNLCERCLKSKDIVKHEEYECLAPPCKICKDSHHTLICRFEKKGVKHVKSQVERRPDDESFNGPDSIKSDQEYTYSCMPRNDESNDKEIVKGNKKGRPDLEDEDVSEISEV